MPLSSITCKSKAILIAVSDGFGGYGDFLFALKLAEQLRKYYRDAGKEVPPIYLVSQEAGKEKIKSLKGDEEFGVMVFTPNELKTKVDAEEIHVSMVIEGPVFQTDLMDSINISLSTLDAKIPLYMLPEYAYNNWGQRITIDTAVEYRQVTPTCLEYAGLIYSGFKASAKERGILLSEALIHPAPPAELIKQLDSKVHKPLFGGGLNIASYQEGTELSMQYSHDIDNEIDNNMPSVHFLNIHLEFCKSSAKNQDVVMVGTTKWTKKAALKCMLDKLKKDGFKRISFYDTTTGEEEVLYDTEEVPAGKSYRVVYVEGMSHVSMIALTALSGPLAGATGDQSFGEALSANKLLVYECLPHKEELIQNYDAVMAAELEDSPEVVETVYLLRNADNDEDYHRLGELLRDPNIREKIIQANKAVLQQFDFISHLIKAEEEFEANIKKRIYELLTSGNPQEALKMLIEHQNRIAFEDHFENVSLIEHAQAIEPDSDFVAYYRICIFAKEGKVDETLAVLEAHQALSEGIFGKCLMAISLKYDPQAIYATRRLSFLLKTGKEVAAMDTLCAHSHRKHIGAVYQSELVIEAAVSANADYFWECFYSLQIIALLKRGNIDEAMNLYIKEERWLKSKAYFKEKLLLEHILELDNKGFFIQHLFEPLIDHVIKSKDKSESQTILAYFIKYNRSLNLISLLKKGTYIQEFIEQDPTNPLLAYYYHNQVIQHLQDANEEDAVGLLRAHLDLIHPSHHFKGSLGDGTRVNCTIYDFAIANNRTIFHRYCKELKLYSSIMWNNKFTYKSALEVLQNTPFFIDLDSVFDGKSLIEHAKLKLPASSPLVIYYHQLKIAQFLKEGQEEAAGGLFRDHLNFRMLNDVFKGTLADGTKFDSRFEDYAKEHQRVIFLKIIYQMQLAELVRNNDTVMVKNTLIKIRRDGLVIPFVSPHFIAHQLKQYTLRMNSKHKAHNEALLRLSNALIDAPELCDHNALIGLLLLIRKDIGSEYTWMTPRKGLFFGGKLYSICDDILHDLGLNPITITPTNERAYFAVLNDALQKVVLGGL